MATPLYLTPHLKGGKTRDGRPAMIHLWFQCNGGSDPVVFSPLISRVRRLVDAGASPFFRVELTGAEPVVTSTGAIVFGVKPDVETAAYVPQELTNVVTASPADTRNASEFDVGVYPRNGTGDDRVDTLGIRVYMQIGWYE
jgi:hypothetical protein